MTNRFTRDVFPLLRRMWTTALTHLKDLPFPKRKGHRALQAIAIQQIHPHALKVLTRLTQAKYQAYLVGGGVRDLLLGHPPKDFDVATNATPEQIKRLFRYAHIIGKRFRLVHVRFDRDIIEVATFRGLSTHTDSHSGLLVSDNRYGSMEEDALRRDFTVNALYLDTQNMQITDYAGGLQDIRKRILRLIGDPETRYREDPVRMLRAARLSAKLQLKLAPTTARWIPKLAPLLENISHARLSDEISKLFLKGHAQASLRALQTHQLWPVLFPATHEAMQRIPLMDRWMHWAAAQTDERVKLQKRLHLAFWQACLLWPAVYAEIQSELTRPKKAVEALQTVLHALIPSYNARVQITKQQAEVIEEILELQLKLAHVHRRSVGILQRHVRFRAAYDFLCLRHDSGDPTAERAQWWTHWLAAPPEEQDTWLKQLPVLKKRRPRKRKTGSANPGASSSEPAAT